MSKTDSNPPQKCVYIFCDGSCLRNPDGAGGWGVLLQYGSTEKELSGHAPSTTNNRMELMAAIQGLEALKQPSDVRLTTDSQYVINGITKWIHGWIRREWITATTNTPVLNKDLWIRLLAAAKPHKVQWIWVRGHNGNKGNERADRLAHHAASNPEFQAALAREHNAEVVPFLPNSIATLRKASYEHNSIKRKQPNFRKRKRHK